MFQTIEQSYSLILQVKLKKEEMNIAGQPERAKNFAEILKNFHDTISKKLENITATLLIFSDRFISQKNEVLLNETTPLYGYGIWANLSKNPRNKEIEFGDVRIEIPKAVAMASIAIRMTREYVETTDDQYLFIGKSMNVEFFQLPTPPKKLTGMTIRQTPSRDSLIQLNYPIKNITAAQPPLIYRIKIDPEILSDFTTDVTVVEILKDNKVSIERIANVGIDNEKKTGVFSSTGIGNFSLAVPRYQHFPFQYWEISPVSLTSVEIFIKTALVDLTIMVNEKGLCSSEAPFKFEEIPPASLLQALQEKGINLVAPKEVPNIKPKDADLEQNLHKGIAETGIGFSVGWSKWNSTLISDRATFLIQEVPDPSNVPEVPENTNKFEKYHCIVAKANHVNETSNDEQANEWNSNPIQNGLIHIHLMPMFFDVACDEVKERVKATPLYMYNSLLFLLDSVRLFSSTI